jgi:hypothetical protein
VGSVYVNGTTPGFPSLADVVRATGLPTRLWSGWEWNTRSSGGFEGDVFGVVVHHTASPATQSFDNDWAYCAAGHQDAPVANMLLGRDGTVGIHSGGASNHAGSSEGPWQSSKGTVPTSSANSRMLGIEAQNAGTGSEPWAPVMLDAYEILVAALCDAYQLDPFRNLPAHAVAGPGWTARKVDPLGDTPDPAAHPYAARDATWDMPQFWSIVAARMGGAPPPGGDDEMPKPFMSALIQATGADGTLPGAVYLTDQIGMTFHWVPNETTLKDLQYALRVAGLSDAIQVVDNRAAFGVLIGPDPTG